MWIKTKIKIPSDYGPQEREAIAQEIIDHIVKRTQEGLDKKGDEFKKYSRSYTKSLDFNNAGKSAGNVNLTMSGDMLAALKLISHKSGELLIGYDNGSEENAKAEGNIKGTYGQPTPIKGKKRDFLGFEGRKENKSLDEILERYPIEDKELLIERVYSVLEAKSEAAKKASKIK